jgi:deoxyribodipyrimidine photo-lyase
VNVTLYWFRNDLRLHDNPALRQAIASGDAIQFIYCHPPLDQGVSWGFERQGHHRRVFLAQALLDLRHRLETRGHTLLECSGDPLVLLPRVAEAVGTDRMVCETIEAPYEQDEVIQLRRYGLSVTTVWQSTLLDIDALPFQKDAVPDVFTSFRQLVEQAGVKPPQPLPEPTRWPSPPPRISNEFAYPLIDEQARQDRRSSFPYFLPSHQGGETAALRHLHQYLDRLLPHRYKTTRNELVGLDFSSKFSPWLAQGAVSARTIHAALKLFEDAHGANEGTYWLWFELLWRDYFRLLHCKYGCRLYWPSGLKDGNRPSHDPDAFERWCQGLTGNRLIDGGMRELSATGYLSNRMRQIVASYLVHDLRCDWRAGAAWFESQLIDYDVYSNHGNWLYITGLGTDPRGGRRFNPEKQAKTHDPEGHYQTLWSQGKAPSYGAVEP